MKDKHEEDPRHLLETAWSIKWDQYGKKMKKWVLSFIPHPHMCIHAHMHTGLRMYISWCVCLVCCRWGQDYHARKEKLQAENQELQVCTHQGKGLTPPCVHTYIVCGVLSAASDSARL